MKIKIEYYIYTFFNKIKKKFIKNKPGKEDFIY